MSLYQFYPWHQYFMRLLNQLSTTKGKFVKTITFASLSLEQAVGNELWATCLQCRGLPQGAAVQCHPIHCLLTAQLWSVEGESGKQQPGVVVDVGLDQTVAVADPDGHHGVHCDPVSGQVARWGKWMSLMISFFAKYE